MPDYSVKPWWQNSRGELFVIVQFALLALIIWGPRSLTVLPPWSPAVHGIARIVGLLLMIAGGSLAAAGTLNLGRNLTPFIYPKAQSVLLESGAFRLVRHPIYSGILQLSCGWALWVQGWLTLGFTILLFLLFDRKARREEQILQQTFSGYAAYARKVRRLIPYLY